jgi:hypothetical protein
MVRSNRGKDPKFAQAALLAANPIAGRWLNLLEFRADLTREKWLLDLTSRSAAAPAAKRPERPESYRRTVMSGAVTAPERGG